MTHQVQLYPSGRRYPAEAQETLLEAGLRSGINLPYRCNNGNCGECLARLRRGDVVRTRHHDHVLSAAEKAAQGILMCSHAAASDLELEVVAASDSHDIPLQQIRTKVVRREWPTADVQVLHLRTPRSQSLRFLAGQHVQLRPEGQAPLDIAIASCPCNGMQLQFHISRRNTHPTAQYLLARQGHGDVLELTGPFGDFLLQEFSRRAQVMLAVDMGFASIKSLLEHAINLDLHQPVRLFWASESGTGRYMENYCRAWAEALDDYAYHPLSLSRSLPGGYDVAALLGEVAALWPELANSDVYLSAGSELSHACRARLLAMGMDDAHVFSRRLRERRR